MISHQIAAGRSSAGRASAAVEVPTEAHTALSGPDATGEGLDTGEIVALLRPPGASVESPGSAVGDVPAGSAGTAGSAGSAAGPTDDQIVQLTGITGLTTITPNGSGDLLIA